MSLQHLEIRQYSCGVVPNTEQIILRLNCSTYFPTVPKIRPGVWYSNKTKKYPMFECMEDFISAVEQAVWQNPKTRESSATWKNRFIKSYENFYGERLNIPRWYDIADKYLK